MIASPGVCTLTGNEVQFDFASPVASIRANPAAAAISRVLARHGISATLVRAGIDGAADTSSVVRVLNRSFEGAVSNGPSDMGNRKARWMLPASETPWRPKAYDRLVLSGETLTIRRVDPGFAYGELVRYDLEMMGQ